MTTATLLRATAALAPREAARLRRRTIFECGKMDPRVGDTEVLAPWAFVIDEAAWRGLARDAEQLARETVALERAALARPELWRELGIPWPLRRALRDADGGGLEAPRIMRFDFHPTDEGWAVSEVNADVPGGFIEAGGFTRLMAEQHAGLQTPPDPAKLLAGALANASAGRDGAIALVHATAFTDDRSIAECLARELRALGCDSRPVAPDGLRWRDGEARFAGDGAPVAAMHRFFPAEWLPDLPRSCGWQHFLAGGATPCANAGAAVLSQSKRLPLLWDRLGIALDAWPRLLPRTDEPRAAVDGSWLLKPAFGRVGGDILMDGITPAKEARTLRRSARWSRRLWIAQKRFRSRAIDSPEGPVHACLGIYTVNGRAAGIYARAARQALINAGAWDVAVLIGDVECEDAAPMPRETRHAVLV